MGDLEGAYLSFFRTLLFLPPRCHSRTNPCSSFNINLNLLYYGFIRLFLSSFFYSSAVAVSFA